MDIKKLNYFLIYTIIMTSFLSCLNNDNHSNKEGNTLNINIGNREKIQASNYFKKIEYIPLQTTGGSLISSIDKLLIENNRIYILDEKKNEILIFGEDGLFLSKLSKQGKGPGEYGKIGCFTINSNTGDIIVIDKLQKNVLIYNKNLEFIENFKFRKYSKICGYSDNQIITYSDNFLEDMNLHFISLKDKKHTDSFLKIDDNLKNAFIGGQFSTNHKGELFFKEDISRNVYKIEKSGIKTSYTINFDSYNMPDNYFEQNIDIKKLLFNLNKGEYAAYPTIPLESERYLFFNYSYDFSKKAVLVNKLNNEIIHGDIINDIDNFAFFNPVLVKDNTLFSFINAHKFRNILEIVRKNNLIPKGTNEKSNLNEIYQNINDEDNPIIVKYSYR